MNWKVDCSGTIALASSAVSNKDRGMLGLIEKQLSTKKETKRWLGEQENGLKFWRRRWGMGRRKSFKTGIRHDVSCRL